MDKNENKEIINEINSILNSREKFINENYLKIRFQFNDYYNLPELDSIRNDICLCILFGLYQASMTLTNHLLETFLKISLTYKEYSDMIENKPKDGGQIQLKDMVKTLKSELKPFMDKHNNKNLIFTINKAFSVGLISEEEKNDFHEFREKFRNAYSHGDRKKQYGDISIPVQAGTTEDGKLKFNPEEEVSLYEMPIFQGIAQWHHAEVYSFPYFEYLDKVIRNTLPKIFPDINKRFDEYEKEK